jgi:hypothetical protein
VAFDAFSLVSPFVFPAEDAPPGTIGLFSYRAEVWESFAGSASRTDGGPDVDVALAGFPDPGSDRVIVVPEVDAEEQVAAFWRAGDDDALDVVVSELREPEVDPGFFERLRSMRFRLWQPKNEGCTYRRQVLACAEQDCSRGECGIESWYAEKQLSVLYGCVCRER